MKEDVTIKEEIIEDHLRNRWVFGCFLIVSGIVIFYNLWGRSLENHGYIRYAEIAREMIRSKEWIIPHLNGEIFVDKPPLLFWLIAIPSTIYGSVTPFIAKLPSAFSAWIGSLILFLWGRKVHGTTQSGLLSGGILLSSYQYFSQSRLAKTDILLCLWIILSLYFFYLAFCNGLEKKKYIYYCFSFFFMGLGVLTKGPFGLFPLLILSIYLIKENQSRLWITKEFILGYLILGLTVLPWMILFVHRIGWDQTMTVIKESKILTRTAPFYYYFIQIWGEFFPGSLFLPFLLIYLWKERKKIWQKEFAFFLIWFLTFFIALTIFKYRASRYLLPALPPFAIMLGGIWKKKVTIFLIFFILSIFAWHIREILWIKKDLFYSPGMALVMELKPFLKDKIPFAYRLDNSTLEEINFYLDPPKPIHIIKDLGDLKKLNQTKGELLLVPKDFYERVKFSLGRNIILLKEFKYKKGKLLLISYSPIT